MFGDILRPIKCADALNVNQEFQSLKKNMPKNGDKKTLLQ
jgi:hypothetical protein